MDALRFKSERAGGDGSDNTKFDLIFFNFFWGGGGGGGKKIEKFRGKKESYEADALEGWIIILLLWLLRLCQKCQYLTMTTRKLFTAQSRTWLFICLLLCCLFVTLFVCLFIYSFVRSFVRFGTNFSYEYESQSLKISWSHKCVEHKNYHLQ